MHMVWSAVYWWINFWSVFYYGFVTGQFYPYPSGLFDWHWGNHVIAPVPVKQPWAKWVNTSCESRAWCIKKNFACQTSKFLHCSMQIMYDLEDNFAKIHLPNWQFYLPQAVGYVEPQNLLPGNLLQIQGSFCECAQPMRDNITLQCRLSLACCIHKRIPADIWMQGLGLYFSLHSYYHTTEFVIKFNCLFFGHGIIL